MSEEKTQPPHVHEVGVFRRELLQIGFLGAFGLMLPQAFAYAAPAASRSGPRAKSIILVWMPGGPPQMHSFGAGQRSEQEPFTPMTHESFGVLAAD